MYKHVKHSNKQVLTLRVFETSHSDKSFACKSKLKKNVL